MGGGIGMMYAARVGKKVKDDSLGVAEWSIKNRGVLKGF